MTKDYLKFRNAIKNDTNLSLEESYLLEILFDYHNVNCGYAFPSYDVLMKDLKTKRRAKVSKLLKSLVNKGYILITKIGKKNTYKLLKYLFIHNSKAKEEAPAQITEEEAAVTKITDINIKQARILLQIAKNKTDKVIRAIEYAMKMKAKNVYAYAKTIIQRNININKVTFKTKIPFLATCEGRNYTEDYYKALEWKLLGWE